MLKKAFKAGQEARSAGRNPLTLCQSTVEGTGAGGRGSCSVASVAAADAHMEALLQELQLEQAGCVRTPLRLLFASGCRCCIVMEGSEGPKPYAG